MPPSIHRIHPPPHKTQAPSMATSSSGTLGTLQEGEIAGQVHTHLYTQQNFYVHHHHYHHYLPGGVKHVEPIIQAQNMQKIKKKGGDKIGPKGEFETNPYAAQTVLQPSGRLHSSSGMGSHHLKNQPRVSQRATFYGGGFGSSASHTDTAYFGGVSPLSSTLKQSPPSEQYTRRPGTAKQPIELQHQNGPSKKAFQKVEGRTPVLNEQTTIENMSLEKFFNYMKDKLEQQGGNPGGRRLLHTAYAESRTRPNVFQQAAADSVEDLQVNKEHKNRIIIGGKRKKMEEGNILSLARGSSPTDQRHELEAAAAISNRTTKRLHTSGGNTASRKASSLKPQGDMPALKDVASGALKQQTQERPDSRYNRSTICTSIDFFPRATSSDFNFMQHMRTTSGTPFDQNVNSSGEYAHAKGPQQPQMQMTAIKEDNEEVQFINMIPATDLGHRQTRANKSRGSRGAQRPKDVKAIASSSAGFTHFQKTKRNVVLNSKYPSAKASKKKVVPQNELKTGMMPINEMYEGYYSGETSEAEEYTPQSNTPVPPRPGEGQTHFQDPGHQAGASPLSRKKKARNMAKNIDSSGQSWRGAPNEIHFLPTDPSSSAFTQPTNIPKNISTSSQKSGVAGIKAMRSSGQGKAEIEFKGSENQNTSLQFGGTARAMNRRSSSHLEESRE